MFQSNYYLCLELLYASITTLKYSNELLTVDIDLSISSKFDAINLISSSVKFDVKTFAVTISL